MNGVKAQDPEHGVRDALARPLSAWETMRAVLWSFFGVRRREGYERDVQRLNPVYVIVAGVLAAVLFVLALVVTVQWVVRSGVAL